MTARDAPASGAAFLARSRRARAERAQDTAWRRPTWILLLGAVATLAAFWWFNSSPLRGRPSYVWVQMMPDASGAAGGRLLRAIVVRGICPTFSEGDETVEMRERPPQVRSAFPVRLCEAELSADKPARLDDWIVPTRPAEPKDIVVIGDTGCRMVHWQVQDCSNPDRWPFAKVAANAARRIAATDLKPFILHVGDFHYREHPCADSDSRCAGSPYGDNWATWQTEFFEPAKDLLRAAPWLIMRGNHEDCERAGAGWIFFFALPHSRKTSKACDDDLQSYSVSIGNTDDGRARKLLVLDTAAEKNAFGREQRCSDYRDTVANALKQYGGNDAELWLALHQPLWLRPYDGKPNNVASNDCGPDPKTALEGIRAMFASRRDSRLVRLVLSGDTHVFQFFWPREKSTPIQIVAGNGGTALDPVYSFQPVADPTAPPRRIAESNRLLDRATASFGIDGSSLSFAQHGFTIMHRDSEIWTVKAFNKEGEEGATCRFSEAFSAKPSDAATDCEPRP